MRGQTSIEFILSFLVVLLFAGILANSIIEAKRRISLPTYDYGLAYNEGMDCLYGRAVVEHDIICINGVCYGAEKPYSWGECGNKKSSFLR